MRWILKLGFLIVPIISLSQPSQRDMVKIPADEFVIDALLSEATQAVRFQDPERLLGLTGNNPLNSSSGNILSQLSDLFQRLNSRPELQRNGLKGTTDYFLQRKGLGAVGDTLQVDVESGFLLADGNDEPMRGRYRMRIIRKDQRGQLLSLDDILEDLNNKVSQLVQSPMTHIRDFEHTIANQPNVLTAFTPRFTNQTLSWRSIPWPIDQNSDGIITEADAISKYNRSLMYTPKDVADVKYPSGEEVYFGIDEAGFMVYMSSSDKTIKFFEPQGTSLGSFKIPKAIVADHLGNVYVLDTYNNRIVKLHYNNSTKTIDTWSVLVTNLNIPFDFDLSYGSSETDASDDRLVVANTGGRNILVINAGNGTVVNTITSYWYYVGEIGGPTSTVYLNSPRSVTCPRWRGIGSGTSNVTIYEIDFDGTSYAMNMLNGHNAGSSPLGWTPQLFPAGMDPSKARVDAFENWPSSYENIWVFDEKNCQLHKFYLATATLKYLSSIGSNGFSTNQFNGPLSMFINQNHTRSSIYTDLMTVERYTSASGGKWFKPGSEVFDLTATVALDRSSATFTFYSIGNSWVKTALVKNSSGQVVADRSIDMSYSPGNQIVFWNTGGNRGNFTFELYLEHVGGVSSVSKTLSFSVPPDPLSVSMSGPTEVYHPEKGQTNTYTWTANPAGGLQPYSYSWFKNGYSQAIYTQSYSQPFSYNGSSGGSYQFTLRVDVRDSQNTLASASKTVTAYNSGGGGIEPIAAPGTDLSSYFIPEEFGIAQNFPNPFNPETNIAFSLPEPSEVKISILDVLGRVVNVLADDKYPAGIHSVKWHSDNMYGDKIGSGIYFYRIRAIGESGKQYIQTKKMLLLK